METSVLPKKGKRLCKKYGFKPGAAVALIETKDGLMLKVIDTAYLEKVVDSLKDVVPTIEEFKTRREK